MAHRPSSVDEYAYTVPYTPCSKPITVDSRIVAHSYDIDCTIDIPSGVTLAIASGAVLKFGSGGSITVEGTLHAVGTSTKPIVFTSANDNSIGGTTGTGSPAEGDWNGIVASESGTIDVEYTVLEYGTTVVEANNSASVDVTNIYDRERRNGRPSRLDRRSGGYGFHPQFDLR